MKKALILFALTLGASLASAQTDTYNAPNGINRGEAQILPAYHPYNHVQNGWYNATVDYTNYKTNTKSAYTLSVKVEQDRVIVISFGNTGELHTGANNLNYIYSGGELDINLQTTVTISDLNGVRYYDIILH